MSNWAFLEAAKQADVNKMRDYIAGDRTVIGARDHGRQDARPLSGERLYDKSTGDSALHLCAFYADEPEAIRFLLDEVGLPLESVGRFGHTVFHYAAWQGHMKVLRYLSRRGAKVRALNQVGENALQIAAKYNKTTAALEYLLDEVKFGVDERGYTEPLLNLGVAVMEYFFNSGFVSQGLLDLTPFLTAISHGNLEAAKLLRARGADIEALSLHGNGALHVASLGTGSVETMGYLLGECHFNINAKGMQGMTPLHMAAACANMRALRYLHFKQADIRLCNDIADNALHISAKYSGSREVLDYLLDDCGLELDVRGGSGMTALHCAAQVGDLALLKHLHVRGAHVQAYDNAGYNALYYAAKYSKSVDTLRYLLEEVGLDGYSIGPENKTALEIAEAENGWIFKGNYSPAVVDFLKGWSLSSRSRVTSAPTSASTHTAESHPLPNRMSSDTKDNLPDTVLSTPLGHSVCESRESKNETCDGRVSPAGQPVPVCQEDTAVFLKKIPPSELDYSPSGKIGVGGYGEVYKGTWHSMTVAIKKLHVSDLSCEARDELMQEAAIMMKISAPNIVKLYGVVVEEGPLMMVMEYLPQSLNRILRDVHVDIAWEQRFSICLDIGKGMAFLHSENIIHRDLKSDNVLLEYSGQAKLADFGLAKIKSEVTSKGTVRGSLAGTLPWIAPEVFEDEETTKRSDVYSYGMTLWEVAKKEQGVAYCFPYENKVKNINTGLVRYILDKGLREDIPEKTPPALGSLMVECWHAEPSKRPTMREVVNDIEAIKSSLYFK